MGSPLGVQMAVARALVEITLNKNSLKILSQDATKESGATLPPATSGTSLSSLPIKRLKKIAVPPGLVLHNNNLHKMGPSVWKP